MSITARLLALLLVTLLAGGCVSSGPPRTRIGTAPYVQGSGVSSNSTRALTPFTAIDATTAVQVTLAAGDRDEAVVTTDDNLLSHVVTEVRDGTLIVTIEGSIETRLLPVVAVTATSPIERLSAMSAVSIEANGLDVDHLSATISSASKLEASGRVGSLEIDVSSGSRADLPELTVETASVSIVSASTVTVRVTGSVTGTCSTASRLHLVGQPTSRSVDVDVSSKVDVE